MAERRPDPLERFFAGALVAVGALIFGLCGLCTLAFTIGSAVSAFSYGGMAVFGPSLLLYGLVGGLPAFGGFMMMRSGWRRLRPAKPKADPKAFD